MMQDVFTTIEIVELTGFTERQLGYWDQQGILKPGVQQAIGSGSRRLYSTEDLEQLNIIRQLKKRGWSTQKIREAITRLRDIMSVPDPLKQAVLVDGDKTLLAFYRTKEGDRVLLDVLSAGGQLAMGIVLEVLIEEARRIVTYSSEEVPSVVSNSRGLIL